MQAAEPGSQERMTEFPELQVEMAEFLGGQMKLAVAPGQ